MCVCVSVYKKRLSMHACVRLSQQGPLSSQTKFAPNYPHSKSTKSSGEQQYNSMNSVDVALFKKSRARQHLFLQLGTWCQGFRDSLHSGLTREWGAQLLPGALPVCWSNKPLDPCCSANPPCLYPLSLVLSRAILTLKIQKRRAWFMWNSIGFC